MLIPAVLASALGYSITSKACLMLFREKCLGIHTMEGSRMSASLRKVVLSIYRMG